MTVLVPTITWLEQSDQNAPLAPSVVNFATDKVWQFQLNGTYHNQQIFPAGVTIDNSQSAGQVQVMVAALTIAVVPFQRFNVDFPPESQNCTITGIAGPNGANNNSTVPISFYRVPTPGSQQNQLAIQTLVDNLTPGFILPFAGPVIPSGWFACNGQAVSRTNFSGLFAVIGTLYGAGDGATTFNVPDIRGRVVSGMDVMDGSVNANRLSTVIPASNILGTAGGNQTGTATTTIGFNSTGTNAINFGTLNGSVTTSWQSTNSGGAPITGAGDFAATTISGNFGITVSGSGSAASGAFSIVQPTILMNYLIKQ